MNQPSPSIKRLLLAEDDEDDFLLFQNAIQDYRASLQLQWVKDGEELMRVLKQENLPLPNMIFLDINMPRKNGFECLKEIRTTSALENLPVIIFSTSSDKALVSWMYNAGANLYLCKPTDFQKLKENIQKAIFLDWETRMSSRAAEDFVLR